MYHKNPSVQTKSSFRLVLVLIFTIFALFYLHSYLYYNINFQSNVKGVFKNIELDIDSNKLDLKLVDKKFSLTHKSLHRIQVSNYFQESEKENFLKINNENFAFSVVKLRTSAAEFECFNISLYQNEAETCFDLNDAYWFGGHESYDQPYWPINTQKFDYVPYVTGYADECSAIEYSAVLERYWISSNGVAIFIDDDIPLFVKNTKENKLCFKSSHQTPPYVYSQGYSKDNKFEYTLCKGDNAKDLQLFMIKNFMGLPDSKPDDLMMKYPVFTTWNFFYRNINQSVVLDFARQIVQNNYPVSQLEIDDKWEVKYGDLDFDLKNFPNPKEMVSQIHKMGMRVSLWVHPFCNIDSYNFVNGSQNEYWVKDPTGEHPTFTRWWNGKDAAILDTTNPNTVKYFSGKLNDLRNKYGIDSFKFDAGETAWIPKNFKLYANNSYLDEYSRNYVKLAAEQNNFIEVRTGNRIQKVGVFYRILDRATNWSIHDGIKSVITETLQFGILGYPFVLPDMICGNDDPDKKDKELFIRWTQLNAFLPAMQFGIPPWYFDEETNEICKRYVDLHVDFVYPYIRSLPIDGQPIIRPIWWLEPMNKDIFNISDQFLVGDDILVAPIVDEGATSRLVYFPSGEWYDIENKRYIQGPVYQVVNADLTQIPYYLNTNGFQVFA